MVGLVRMVAQIMGGTVDSFPVDAKTKPISRRSSTVSNLEVVVGDGAVGGTMTTKVAVRKFP